MHVCMIVLVIVCLSLCALCRYLVDGQCWQKHQWLPVLSVHCQNWMVFCIVLFFTKVYFCDLWSSCTGDCQGKSDCFVFCHHINSRNQSLNYISVFVQLSNGFLIIQTWLDSVLLYIFFELLHTQKFVITFLHIAVLSLKLIVKNCQNNCIFVLSFILFSVKFTVYKLQFAKMATWWTRYRVHPFR